MTWRPYLPDPRPALRFDLGDPEPVPLDALRVARDLCATFHLPPRQFRRRTVRGVVGYYSPRADVVAVDPDRAASDGMGGDDGYYVCLLEELLHATGHPSRLDRKTVGDYSPEGYQLEERTTLAALRIVLAALGFPEEALQWHAPCEHELSDDRHAAEAAASWVLA